MKPTLTTPDTLILGCWHEDQRCAIVASLRSAEQYLPVAESVVILAAAGRQVDHHDANALPVVTRFAYHWGGFVRPAVGEWSGLLWPTLAGALDELVVVGCRHLLLVTNDAALCSVLTSATPPPPLRTTRQWVLGWGKKDQKGAYVEVPWGGDADHWQVLVHLGMTWSGHWQVICRPELLEKARELWLRTSR